MSTNAGDSRQGSRPVPAAPAATAHEVLAVVLQVTDSALHVLLWQHDRGPAAGCWALPGGPLMADETLGQSVARQLAEKVDVRHLAHLEQLETRSDLNRTPDGSRSRDGLPRTGASG